MKWLVAMLIIGASIVALWVIVSLRTNRPANAQGASAPSPTKRTSYEDGRAIPVGGLVVDPQSVGHPGDPANAERDFRRLYQAMTRFRAVEKRLPTPRELMDTSRPIVPGLQLTKEDLNNPDERYAEGPDGRRGLNRTFDYVLAYVRPREDGAPKPAFLKSGERDVWLECRLYERRNQVALQFGPDRLHFAGIVVALFSDGSIERIPQSKQLTLARGNVRPIITPGQAGIPKAAFPITRHWREHYPNATWE
jgi:hypothetical protein